MKLVIEINCDNAAFEDGNLNYECNRILEDFIRYNRVDALSKIPLRDSNGNTVGFAQFKRSRKRAGK